MISSEMGYDGNATSTRTTVINIIYIASSGVTKRNAPSIKERITALGELRLAGVRTFAMITPMLPKTEELAVKLRGKVDYVLLDRMNYHYGDWVYRKYGLERAMNDDFFSVRAKELLSAFNKQGIECRVVF